MPRKVGPEVAPEDEREARPRWEAQREARLRCEMRGLAVHVASRRVVCRPFHKLWQAVPYSNPISGDTSPNQATPPLIRQAGQRAERREAEAAELLGAPSLPLVEQVATVGSVAIVGSRTLPNMATLPNLADARRHGASVHGRRSPLLRQYREHLAVTWLPCSASTPMRI